MITALLIAMTGLCVAIAAVFIGVRRALNGK